MARYDVPEFEALRKLLESTAAIAVPAAENAAAEVYREAISAAAPRRTGQLSRSVKVFEGKNRGALTQEFERRRLLVGPEKKKGFYGYFVEKGWTATGSRRKGRTATKTTHSQRGVSGGRKISGRPWFGQAVKSADSRALQAAEEAFNNKLNQLAAKV